MLRAALQRGQGAKTAYVLGTGENLPFASTSFDAVLIVTVLCFLRNPQDLIREAYRVLRTGGRLIVGELGRYSIWAISRQIRGFLGNPVWRRARFYSAKELQGMLKLGGFEQSVVRGAVFYPPIRRANVLRAFHRIENGARRLCSRAFLVVRGLKRRRF
jgi:ubiquinone/menaquinone biosynthesis C-methylase UbiE